MTIPTLGEFERLEERVAELERIVRELMQGQEQKFTPVVTDGNGIPLP